MPFPFLGYDAMSHVAGFLQTNLRKHERNKSGSLQQWELFRMAAGPLLAIYDFSSRPHGMDCALRNRD